MTDKKIIEAIKGKDGIITKIADALQVDTRAARILINRNDKTKAAYRDEVMKVRDMAEANLIRAAETDPEMAAKLLATDGM